jgi:hypothetical protein
VGCGITIKTPDHRLRDGSGGKVNLIMLTENIAPFPQQNQSDSVSIINMRPNPKPGGSTLAYADVKVGPITILGISVVRNKNGGEFVAFPARSGNGRWFPVVEVEEPAKHRVVDLILEAWKKFNATPF